MNRQNGNAITGITIILAIITCLSGCEAKSTEYESTEQQERIHIRLHDQKSVKEQTSVQRKPVKAAGIYVSGIVAGNKKMMNQLIGLMKQTDLNTVVIDLKNEYGHVTYDSNVPLVNQIHADRKLYIPDMVALIQTLKRNDIYIIGRVVSFRDPYLAASKNHYAMIRKNNGNRWRDRNGIIWVDPYKEQVRSYNLDIAKEAAALGVHEIQFDYVRFPDNGKAVDRDVNFDNPKMLGKADLIGHFLRDARQQLKPLGVYISADVFGLTTTLAHDMGIGQDWNTIASEVDYISPMIYPSHYSNGVYGIRHPDLSPYAIARSAIRDGMRKNKSVNGTPAVIRPWFQSFTAVWIDPHKRYGKAEIEAQIRAAKEQGVDQYLLWNPACKYDYLK